MNALRVFVIALSAILIGFMLVVMFGALLPAMISSDSTEAVLFGFFLMFVLIAGIAASSYRIVITLKELLK